MARSSSDAFNVLDGAAKGMPHLFVVSGMHGGAWTPPMDVYGTRDTITVKAAISGVRREDIEVDFTGRSLRISGVREENCEECKEGYYMMEISYGYFEREIPMPSGVAGDEIDAVYRDGFLIVTIPLRADAEETTREIEVK